MPVLPASLLLDNSPICSLAMCIILYIYIYISLSLSLILILILILILSLSLSLSLSLPVSSSRSFSLFPVPPSLSLKSQRYRTLFLSLSLSLSVVVAHFLSQPGWFANLLMDLKCSTEIGHFLRGRSLKGRCNICVYVPVCVCVCSCVCPSSPPHDPAHTVGLNSRIRPTPAHDPSPPFPHPCPQAIARVTFGKNYPLKSARRKGEETTRNHPKTTLLRSRSLKLKGGVFWTPDRNQDGHLKSGL